MRSVLYILWILGAAAAGLSQALAQDFDSAKAAVVKIIAAGEEQTKFGTGVVVKVDGDEVYIVTAAHVVRGDKHPKVVFYARRTTLVIAEVLKTEGGKGDGLALLAVRGKANIPPQVRSLPLSQDESLEGGHEVVAIGFGQGQGDWAVIRAGVASVSGRDITVDGRIEEGNSGGPLLRQGEVVGLLTDVKQGFGIATPSFTVTRILKRWGVDTQTAALRTPPAAEPAAEPATATATPAVPPPSALPAGKYALLPQAIRVGRKLRTEGRSELRGGKMTVEAAGRVFQGSSDSIHEEVIEDEVLAASAGRINQLRITIPTLRTTVTRHFEGEIETDDDPNSLQGKSVLATRAGDTWQFESAQPLSPAEITQLKVMVPDSDGMPSQPVAVGHQWEIPGAALPNFLRMGDMTWTGGAARMRFDRVTQCGAQQCAEISLTLDTSGFKVNEDGSQTAVKLTCAGKLLRVLASDLNKELQLTGTMAMTITAVAAVGPMQVAIHGPFTLGAKIVEY